MSLHKTHFMKYAYLVFLFLLLSTGLYAQADSVRDKRLSRVLSAKEMQEDLAFLRRVLWETHPGLDRYTSKKSLQRKVDSIARLTSRPLSFYEYYGLLARLISDIRCAHTYIVPDGDINRFIGEIKSFPMQLQVIGERVFVGISGATDTTFRPGVEIVSIDGRPVKSILDQFYKQTWADGYILSSKKAMLSGDGFSFFYYALVARPDTFLVTVKDLAGRKIVQKLAAVSPMTYHPYYLKNPVNQSLIALHTERNKKDQSQPWRVEFPGKPGVAVLRIKGFGGGNNGKEAAAKMRAFMDTTIMALKKNNVTDLIIDVRDNGGGWDIQGVELFTYLMKDTTPVRYYARKHSITDSTEFIRFSDLSEEDRANIKKELMREADGTFTVKDEFNDDLKLQYAKPNRFTGNVYFLINGGSASTTSEFVAVARSHRLGIFVGEESGGAYEGGNGGSFLHFNLPNSGINVGTPLLYYRNGVRRPSQPGGGVIPDHHAIRSMDDIMTGRDSGMEQVMKLIDKKR